MGTAASNEEKKSTDDADHVAAAGEATEEHQEASKREGIYRSATESTPAHESGEVGSVNGESSEHHREEALNRKRQRASSFSNTRDDKDLVKAEPHKQARPSLRDYQITVLVSDLEYDGKDDTEETLVHHIGRSSASSSNEMDVSVMIIPDKEFPVGRYLWLASPKSSSRLNDDLNLEKTLVLPYELDRMAVAKAVQSTPDESPKPTNHLQLRLSKLNKLEHFVKYLILEGSEIDTNVQKNIIPRACPGILVRHCRTEETLQFIIQFHEAAVLKHLPSTFQELRRRTNDAGRPMLSFSEFITRCYEGEEDDTALPSLDSILQGLLQRHSVVNSTQQSSPTLVLPSETELTKCIQGYSRTEAILQVGVLLSKQDIVDNTEAARAIAKDLVAAYYQRGDWVRSSTEESAVSSTADTTMPDAATMTEGKASHIPRIAINDSVREATELACNKNNSSRITEGTVAQKQSSHQHKAPRHPQAQRDARIGKNALREVSVQNPDSSAATLGRISVLPSQSEPSSSSSLPSIDLTSTFDDAPLSIDDTSASQQAPPTTSIQPNNNPYASFDPYHQLGLALAQSSRPSDLAKVNQALSKCIAHIDQRLAQASQQVNQSFKVCTKEIENLMATNRTFVRNTLEKLYTDILNHGLGVNMSTMLRQDPAFNQRFQQSYHQANYMIDTCYTTIRNSIKQLYQALHDGQSNMAVSGHFDQLRSFVAQQLKRLAQVISQAWTHCQQSLFRDVVQSLQNDIGQNWVLMPVVMQRFESTKQRIYQSQSFHLEGTIARALRALEQGIVKSIIFDTSS